MDSDTFDTNLPVSGPGFCQNNVSLFCAPRVQLVQPAQQGEKQSGAADHETSCSIQTMWFVTQSGALLCRPAQGCCLQASGKHCSPYSVFGTNLLVCTKVQISFLLLFYMTQSCCYTLYFNMAPSLGAKTQESEYSCIPGFFLRLFCALEHS